MDHTRYRPDIDGLRALAVLSVLLFHLDVKAFSGGYIGVDIFFVISGFLITRLIRDEVSRSGRLSFTNFYLRRARRLMPAFLFTLTACFIIAFFLFPPPQMEQFSRSLVYSAFGMANINFWRESGYFDVASVYKPLLHIWSLSVEEQFYLVWPLLLSLLLIKTPKRLAPIALVGAFGISLYLNFPFASGNISLLTNLIPAAADWFAEGLATIFYLMPFRVFEFAIGALLVWVIEYQPKNKWLLEPLLLAGFVLAIYPMFAYTEDTLFPSYNALMPCLGAALLIYGGGESQYLGKILRTPLLVEIGKISYSLYLVHWPAIVFFKYYIYDFGALSTAEQIVIGVAAILAARLMYTYIEQPFRKSTGEKPKVPTRAFLTIHGTSLLILIVLSTGAWNDDGWAWRMPGSLTTAEINQGQNVKAGWQSGCNLFNLESTKCHRDAPLQVLFIGDSHYYVGYNMFAAAFNKNKNINLISFGAINRCDFAVQGKKLAALGSGTRTRNTCQERADTLSDPAFNQHLKVLVLSSQTAFEKGAELPIVEYLKSVNHNLKLVIIGPYIDVRPYECADIINRFGSSAFCKDKRFVSDFGDNVQSNPYYGAFMKYDPLYINTVTMLCSDGTLASCTTSADGVPMFYDSNHPSFEFSMLMSKRMLEVYATALEKIGFTAAGK